MLLFVDKKTRTLLFLPLTSRSWLNDVSSWFVSRAIGGKAMSDRGGGGGASSLDNSADALAPTSPPPPPAPPLLPPTAAAAEPFSGTCRRVAPLPPAASIAVSHVQTSKIISKDNTRMTYRDRGTRRGTGCSPICASNFSTKRLFKEGCTNVLHA